MVGLYILVGIVIFFWLLLQVSAGVRVIYNSRDADSLRVYAQVGLYKLHIIPAKPKKIKKKRPALLRRKKAKKIAEEKFEGEKKKRAGKQQYKAGEMIGLAKDMGLILLKKTRKYLKIRVYKAGISVGADDAYKAARLYGNINQAAYYIYEILSHHFNFKAKNISISSDFLSERINFDIDVKISMRLGAGLNMAVAAAMSFVRLRMKSKKNNINEEENKWQTAT